MHQRDRNSKPNRFDRRRLDRPVREKFDPRNGEQE
jgi:hypothetical protein